MLKEIENTRLGDLTKEQLQYLIDNKVVCLLYGEQTSLPTYPVRILDYDVLSKSGEVGKIVLKSHLYGKFINETITISRYSPVVFSKVVFREYPLEKSISIPEAAKVSDWYIDRYIQHEKVAESMEQE